MDINIHKLSLRELNKIIIYIMQKKKILFYMSNVKRNKNIIVIYMYIRYIRQMKGTIIIYRIHYCDHSKESL